jgi:hypothetical protein
VSLNPTYLVDFRVDFLASCVYGIWTCLIVRCRPFTDPRCWSLIGAIGAPLIVADWL